MTTMVIVGGLLVGPDGTAKLQDLKVVDGVITEVGDLFEPASADRVIDAAGCLVLPGMVNMHSHSYGTLCRHDGAGLPLEPWMNYAISGTVGRTPEEITVATQLHAIEALRTGTTALIDHIGGAVSSLGSVLAAYEQIGIRARVAPMIGDIPLPDSVGLAPGGWPIGSGYGAPEFIQKPGDELIAETLALRSSWVSDSKRVEVIFGPSAPQRVSERWLRGIAEVSAEEGMLVHTHLLETRVQAALQPPGRASSWVKYLDDVGLLGPRLSTAHNVWVDESDLQLLAERRVTLVHDPHSNLQVGSGIADLGAWRKWGVRAALGTDSVNCGGSMDMVDAMRLAVLLHRVGQPDPALWETAQSGLALATAGASALGIGSGTLEVGQPADIAVFEMADASYATREDPLGTLVLGSWNHSARTVMVHGEVVLHDYLLQTIDEAAVVAEAVARRAALLGRNEHLTRLADRQRAVLTDVSKGAPYPRAVIPSRQPE